MMSEYVDRYAAALVQALHALDRGMVWGVIEELLRCWREGRHVFLIGNGGSAATASHMANDLNRLDAPGQPRMKAISLTDNVSLITALANDTDYVNIFAEQLRNFCQPGDVVIAISCSGNSPNVLAGLELAHKLGARTIGFTGDTGGKLSELVDLCVYAPVSYIGQQEDVHMMLDHVITGALREWIEAISMRKAQPIRALVLAAGEGTRLRPLTLTRPKPMAPINGRPLLHYTLEWLQGHGIHDVAINLNHCPEVIVSYFTNGVAHALDMRLHYSYENPILGTAGAVRKLSEYLSSGPFVVVYGDVLTDFDLGALINYHHEKVVRDPSTGVTLSLYHVPNPTEVGLVGMDAGGRVNRFLEKPRPEEVFTDLANAGVLVVEPSVIQYIPANTFYDFGLHLLPELLEQDVSIYGWVVPPKSYLLDIGSIEKYEQAQREWHVHQEISRR